VSISEEVLLKAATYVVKKCFTCGQTTHDGCVDHLEAVTSKSCGDQPAQFCYVSAQCVGTHIKMHTYI